MAYSSLTNQQLAVEARELINVAENALGRAISRMDELTARGCDCPAPGVEPMPTPDPMPMPVPSGSDIGAVDAIPSNFDKAPWIKTTSGTTASMAPDIVGAFRLTGNVSHYAYDDPIVFPGKPGASHLHEFVGNTLTDAFSTYASLRSGGNGTTEGGKLNRTAYWAPAWLLGDMILVPDFVTIYYKRMPQGSPYIPAGKQVADLPRGLRMITRGGKFKFDGPNGATDTGNLAEAAKVAAPGGTFIHGLHFPTAWDGQRTDSANHMDHVTGGGFIIPEISYLRHYTILPGEDFSKIELASDRAMGAAPGTTSHGDYFEAWDDDIRVEFHANAIDKMLNCSGGDLGDGRKLIRPAGWTLDQQPKRIPLADVPVGGSYRLIG